MTDRINPITDILERFSKWTITNAEHGIYIPLPSPETEQALYEAVIVSSPGRSKPKTDYDKGWNDANEAWFTNLSLLFGVADVGGLEKPKGGSK